jgi:hypothetical protein
VQVNYVLLGLLALAVHVHPADLLSSIAAALAGCKALMHQLHLELELQRLTIEQPMREAATSLVSFAHSVLSLFNSIAAVWPYVINTHGNGTY